MEDPFLSWLSHERAIVAWGLDGGFLGPSLVLAANTPGEATQCTVQGAGMEAQDAQGVGLEGLQ